MKSATVLVIVVVLWAVGLMAFASRVADSTPPAEPPVADGVVALTGASTARLTAAVHLLETGKARRALISGVNQKASRADIRGVTKATRRYYDCCVDLGFSATDTVGNARETAGWTREHHYRSLIVVTSDFHIPRAMLELRAAMPEVRLTPYPVKSEELDAGHWWRTREGARRMVVEYCKYLAILTREAVLSLGPKEHHKALAPSSAAPPSGTASGGQG
jgi:uncharacterized SAM-binding protein YcdF (DUF218 family)